MTETINILIADDHAIVREGLRALITAKPGMAVVGAGPHRVGECGPLVETEILPGEVRA